MKDEETLEEAAKNYIENTMKFSFNFLETKTQANRMLKCVEFGAKWQQERMYSEEEVLNFTQTIIQQYKFGNTNIEQLDLLKETLQQFKKK